MTRVQIITGDCLVVLKDMADNSVDAVVTDPPYGLGKEPDALAMLRDWMETGHHDVRGSGFMGKAWDAFVPQPALWRECLRVLKPGGHVVAFAGTRTHDLMTLGLRLAGFEIRDTLMWVYGSGFPKSHDVAKAIDKAAGHWRGRAGAMIGENDAMSGGNYERTPKGDPVTAAAAACQGWGTALKPALEPITLARKPLIGTVAENVLAHGTGGLNVDGCRVGTELLPARSRGVSKLGTFEGADGNVTGERTGRWPANLIHDGSDEVLGLFPQASSGTPSDKPRGRRSGGFGDVGADKGDGVPNGPQYGDTGSAARFFYCAKASKKDRNEGLENFQPRRPAAADFRPNHTEKAEAGEDGNPYGRWGEILNHHPTVKPTDLMRWLCRLITPPGGVILDPFMGSGSTGKAAVLEGFRFVGVEMDPEYVEIAKARIAAADLPQKSKLQQKPPTLDFDLPLFQERT